ARDRSGCRRGGWRAKRMCCCVRHLRSRPGHRKAGGGRRDSAGGAASRATAGPLAGSPDSPEADLRRAINQRLLQLVGMPADDIVLLAPGLLPKTSSGKLQRAACRQAYQRGSLGRRQSAAAWQWLRLGARAGVQRAAQAARAAGRLLYTIYFWPVFLILLLACWFTLVASPSGR